MLEQTINITTTNKKKSGGSKKIGRNKAACSRYRSMNVKEKNKVRRFKKFLKHTNSSSCGNASRASRIGISSNQR